MAFLESIKQKQKQKQKKIVFSRNLMVVNSKWANVVTKLTFIEKENRTLQIKKSITFRML
jgi:hypothetical protein